ncbi:MAG: superoxide dismutase family protein [Lachnospiraceae bacterium]|nr:superoxide dismutase family protein [Lachnospiraceae bacterium]
MRSNTPGTIFSEILREGQPQAVAWISGNAANPQLSGVVKFYDTPYEGILIEAEVFGLPNVTQPGSSNFYALHIHENGNCTKPFQLTGAHYSRTAMPHPYHSGDLLPLLGNQGYAWLAFYDKRITIAEINGRSVIIHAQPDDFTTQPSGNSGEKIGCGVIRMM